MAWNTSFPLRMWKLRKSLSVFFFQFLNVPYISNHYIWNGDTKKTTTPNSINKTMKMRQNKRTPRLWGISLLRHRLPHFVSSSRTTLSCRVHICFSSFQKKKKKHRGVVQTWEKRSLTAAWDYIRYMETATTNGEFSVNTRKALCVIPSFIPIFSSSGANCSIMIKQPANWLCLL